VAEYIHRTTYLKRRKEIQAEIALLREEFKKIIERGENKERDKHIQLSEHIGNLDSNVSNHKNNSMLEEMLEKPVRIHLVQPIQQTIKKRQKEEKPYNSRLLGFISMVRSRGLEPPRHC
jgi:hypothetical protein